MTAYQDKKDRTLIERIEDTTTTLHNYNKWRRGSDTVKQPNPQELGKAIDSAIDFLKRYKGIVVMVENMAKARK